MFDRLQYRILRRIAPAEPTHMDGSAFAGQSKIERLLGDAFLTQVRGRDVIDFGCGEGAEAVDLALHGARVIGVDMRESVLRTAREQAQRAGVADTCTFFTSTDTKADFVISIDAFEHFEDPANVLGIMYGLLRPGGQVFVAFGPTWFHPYGGHLFSVFPWAHLIFSEQSLIKWRSHIRSDGATRFGEVEGGLNQITIRRFERLAAESAFVVEEITLVPIRKLARFHNRLTREFSTSIVRARLRKPITAPASAQSEGNRAS